MEDLKRIKKKKKTEDSKMQIENGNEKVGRNRSNLGFRSSRPVKKNLLGWGNSKIEVLANFSKHLNGKHRFFPLLLPLPMLWAMHSN